MTELNCSPAGGAYIPVPGDFELLSRQDINVDRNFASQGYWKGVAIHFFRNKAEPPLFKVSDTHYAATWLLHPDAPKVEMPPELKARLERARKEAEKYL